MFFQIYKGLDQQIPALVQALRAVQRQPDSARAQLTLINAAQDFIQPASRLIGAANAAAPTVSDQAAALNLHNAVKFMSSAIAELRSSANKVFCIHTCLHFGGEGCKVYRKE